MVYFDKMNNWVGMPKIEKFEDLIVWQEARKLNRELFFTLKDCNLLFFRDQVLRASLSVTSNIAEGFERQSKKEFVRFLYIARASCGELRSQLYLGWDTGLFSKEKAMYFIESCKRISYLIFKLIQSISRSL